MPRSAWLEIFCASDPEVDANRAAMAEVQHVCARVCASRAAMADVARRLYQSSSQRHEGDAAPASAAASSGGLGEGPLEAPGTSWRDENSEERSVPSSIRYAFSVVAGFDHEGNQ